MGKSKLRKQDVAPLGPQYAGARISRDSALEDDEHDPFAQEDEEEDDDGEDAAADDFENDSDSEDEEEDGDEAQDTPDTDMSGEEESDEDMEDDGDNAAERDELRRLLKEDQKTVTTNLSQAAKADVEKGQAVKAQRTTFDALLNTRIRLQKALIATNSFPFASDETENEGSEVTNTIAAAEDAAVKLWTSLNELRTSLHTARTGNKRKQQPDLTISSPSKSFWTQMQSYESSFTAHRKNVLDKWSTKSRGAAALPTRGRLNNTGSEQALSDVLNGHLTDMPRLLKRARTPRSCAPMQVQQSSKRGRNDPEEVEAANSGVENIFDDADFYTLLLRELVEQRSSDATSGIASATISDMPSWQVAREARTKKQVDTRASKGRKLRYTVHEKLQNFMAPEDRTTWSQRQADELFGSLFGKTMPLAENDEQEEDDEDHIDPEEAGLMLFRR